MTGFEPALLTSDLNTTVDLRLASAQDTGHGMDTFARIAAVVTGAGNDTITDFNATSNREDIDPSAVTAITDFSDLLADHMQQSGANVVTDDGQTSRSRS